MNVRNIPDELQAYDQWVMWKLEEVPKRDKPSKVPYQINGFRAVTTNSKTWADFRSVCLSLGNDTFTGGGFVFCPDDPFAGIDLDDCIQEGQISDYALKVIRYLNSYTEISQSGAGVHIIVKAKLPDGRKRKDGFEMYDSGRFFVVTGEHLAGTPRTIEDRQKQVDVIHERLFGKPIEQPRRVPNAASVTLEDNDIIKLGVKARNGDKFQSLYRGDWQRFYESQSQADLAFCNMLAFYTQSYEQIERIFDSSGLNRDKWDREDYRKRTIETALLNTTDNYRGKKNSLTREA